MESNIGLFISYSVTLLIMVGVPIALTILAVRRFRVSWWVILVGVVSFLITQSALYYILKLENNIFNQAFNSGLWPVPPTTGTLLLVAVIISAVTALVAEAVRYFGFLVIRKKTKRIESGLGFGVASGGIESLGVAVWPYFPLFGGALITFLKILFYNYGAQLAKGVAVEQVQAIAAQFASFWTNPWLLGFLPGVDRLIAFSGQIFLSVLIWKAVRSRNFGWFALAFFYHMLTEAIANFLTYLQWGSWQIEGIMAIFMLANIYLIYYFWKEESDKRKARLEEKAAEASEEGVELTEDFDEEDDDEDEDEDFDDDDDFDDDEETDDDDLFESVDSEGNTEDEDQVEKPEEK